MGDDHGVLRTEGVSVLEGGGGERAREWAGREAGGQVGGRAGVGAGGAGKREEGGWEGGRETEYNTQSSQSPGG